MSEKKRTCALVLNYNEVILFPPTFNAIHLLAEAFDEIFVLEVGNKPIDETLYPSNVSIYTISKKENTYLGKLRTFQKFLSGYRKHAGKLKPDLVLFYDAMCVMTVYLCKPFLRNSIAYWYHNHDVVQKQFLTGISLLRLSYFFERRIMKHLDIFSLPSDERKIYFNMRFFKGIYHFIPNFPSIKIFPPILNEVKDQSSLRIIYQGNINVGHGIEELINLLPLEINKKPVFLGLIGFVFGDYRRKMEVVINARNLSEYVKFYDPVPYPELRAITNEFHIGLAVYTKVDPMNSTLGTASNKIYEYTACGLPFLYYDTPHFRKHLEKMPWALATDLSEESIISALTRIQKNYDEMTDTALQQFTLKYNYESVFQPVIQEVISGIRGLSKEPNTTTP